MSHGIEFECALLYFQVHIANSQQEILQKDFEGDSCWEIREGIIGGDHWEFHFFPFLECNVHHSLMGQTCDRIEMGVCYFRGPGEMGRHGENFGSSPQVWPTRNHHAINPINPVSEMLRKCSPWLKTYKDITFHIASFI